MSETGTRKRMAVLEAALELFVERGFHGAPTSLIAQRAGVGVGTIYRYFSSKDELIHAIYHELHARFHRQFVADLEKGGSLRERVARVLERLLDIFIRSPREFRFLEQYHYSPFADDRRPEIPVEEHSFLRDLLEEGRADGIFRDGPLEVLQAVALGPIISLAKEHIAGRLTVDRSTVGLATGACWEALLRR